MYSEKYYFFLLTQSLSNYCGPQEELHIFVQCLLETTLGLLLLLIVVRVVQRC